MKEAIQGVNTKDLNFINRWKDLNLALSCSVRINGTSLGKDLFAYCLFLIIVCRMMP